MEKLQYGKFQHNAQSPQGCYTEEDRVDWFNRSAFEKKERYDCTVCLDKGIVQRVGPLGLPVTVPCECAERKKKQKRYIAVMEHSGLGKRFQNQSFQNFQTTEPWMKDMLKKARIWAAGSVGWLLISGQSGCGKTHLGLSVCRERFEKWGQVFMILCWREFFTRQSKTSDKEAFLEQLREAKEAPLLYLDDFLKTGRNYWEVTSWEQDLAFELLDYRYNAGLDTVISTEWSPEELRSINEALAGRIMHAAGKNVIAVARDPKKNFRYRVS